MENRKHAEVKFCVRLQTWLRLEDVVDAERRGDNLIRPGLGANRGNTVSIGKSKPTRMEAIVIGRDIK